jgi:hypothetical protein
MNKGIAIPYFKSEWGLAYTQQQQQQIENVSARGSKSAGPISNSSILFFVTIYLIYYIRIIEW